MKWMTGCAAAGLLLLAAACHQVQPPAAAPTGDVPPAVKALEDQGLTIMDEFEAGDGLRAFAAFTGERPIGVYVVDDGSVIVGTRVGTDGQALDEDTLGRLVARPLSSRIWSRLETAHWVADGRADAPRTIYVFTDPNCPYCHRFWEAARPWVAAGRVQLRHIMVGIIREDSPQKAAAILGAPDPAAALLENETKFDRGGITPVKTLSAQAREALDGNEALMQTMGLRGTPGIVVLGEDGMLRTYSGMPGPDALGDVMGPS